MVTFFPPEMRRRMSFSFPFPENLSRSYLVRLLNHSQCAIVSWPFRSLCRVSICKPASLAASASMIVFIVFPFYFVVMPFHCPAHARKFCGVFVLLLKHEFYFSSELK